ncbi:hypothetical protein R1flu_001558 [Riccia fluitans]|uniref:Uncharacterized protein n=1 Tax=Riccia fluitans TaxID=41844 RepID=A0ABD1Y3L6_9MARC
MRALVAKPKLLCQVFWKMHAYGNHYQVVSDILRVDECKTYDCGIVARADVIAEVPQDRDISHVGVLMHILQLDYGLDEDNPVLFQGKWVRNDAASFKHDKDGFLMANIRRWLFDRDDPFIFPSQVEQVFFIPVEEGDVLGWNIVLRKYPRGRRVVMEQSSWEANGFATADSEIALRDMMHHYEIVEIQGAQQAMNIAEEENMDSEVDSFESESEENTFESESEENI